jgi:hypothetical protein
MKLVAGVGCNTASRILTTGNDAAVQAALLAAATLKPDQVTEQPKNSPLLSPCRCSSWWQAAHLFLRSR